MELQLIRNATLKLRYGGVTFLIDPYLAPKYSQPAFAGRSPNPVVDLPSGTAEILGGIDCVLVSHLHPDHFDSVAQSILPKDIKLLCQPQDYEAILSFGFTNVAAVDRETEIGGVTISRTRGQHGTGAVLAWMGPVSGFVFQAQEEETLYWAGDTIWCEAVKQHIEEYNPGIIICHAGGNVFLKGTNIFGEPFREDTERLIMDKEQVLEVCVFSPESIVVATHLEALDHETVTRTELRDYAMQHSIEISRLLIPADGEKLTL